MKFKISFTSTGKRLAIVCEEEQPKTIVVTDHYKVVNGKKVYVKTHLRKR